MAKKTTKKKTTRTKSTPRAKAAKKAGKASTAKAAKSAKKVTRKATKASKPAAAASKTTKKATRTTKSAPKKSAAATGDKPTKRPRKIKTAMTTKELRHYRDLLIEKRVELIGDIVGMEEAALRGKDQSNLSTMPLHMADVGSDTYDQDLMLGLMESERKLLVEIDEALVRIADRTFGVCQSTGKPINKARLEVKPWAKYSIEVAREMERNGGRASNNGR